MASITIKCPNLGNNADTPCEHEFELECDVEPADPSYGSDADGNRGIYLPPYIIEPDPPVNCPECLTIFDDAMTKDLEEQIKVACQDWQPADDYDPPDDYYVPD